MDAIFATPDSGVQHVGSVAQRLLASGFDPQVLRTCDVLRKEEWKELDRRIIEEVRLRMNIVADFQRAGMRFALRRGLGATVLEWERQSDMEAAQVSMDGVTRGRGDAVEFDLQAMPLPITHKDFYISVRKLEASRKLGEPIDTTQAALSGTIVMEKIEDTFVNGLPAINFGGGSVHGLITFPDRVTGQLIAAAAAPNGRAWTAAEKTGEEVWTDVANMVDAARLQRHYGPYTLYVPADYQTRLDQDFKAESDKTVRQRILEIEGVSAVRTADFLPTGNVLLVQMRSQVADFVDALQPTSVQWDLEGGFRVGYKVFAIMVPRPKSTYEGRSGIIHYTVAAP